jgi:predicted glycosyltransferase
MHIVCSSQNIYDAINENSIPQNVSIYNQVLDSSTYYSDACLIITRSGRNTLSELVYLGIPAISFVSGCSYRKDEQKQNMNCLSNSNIVPASLEIMSGDLKDLCLNMIERGLVNNKFECGNDIALEKIISL